MTFQFSARQFSRSCTNWLTVSCPLPFVETRIYIAALILGLREGLQTSGFVGSTLEMHSSELLISSVCAFGTWINAESSKRVHDGSQISAKLLRSFLRGYRLKKRGHSRANKTPPAPEWPATDQEYRSYSFSTLKSFMTENTPGTEFARMPAMFLSAWVATTPSSDT